MNIKGSQDSESNPQHSLLIVLQLCISFLAAFLAMHELFLSSSHHWKTVVLLMTAL